MKYYFLSGRNFDLSQAELLSLLDQYTSNFNLEYVDDVAIIVETKEETDFSQLFNRLGGFLSFGKIVEPDFDFTQNLQPDQKVVFAINVYGQRNGFNINTVKKLADGIKRGLKESGMSSKFLVNNDLSINALEVRKNKIIEKGFLLEIMSGYGKTYYGLALGVQDIESFSAMEYDKPYTDKRMGVLPSKLARIMINLAGLKKGQTLWDPFCGSGTLLLEGFAQGLNVIGSDVSGKAINMSQANIDWLGAKTGDATTKFNIFKMDILKPDWKVLSLLRKTQLDAVVCEPFMGPPQLTSLPQPKARIYLEAVKKLYVSLFEILDHSKLSNFKAVIVVPSYKTHQGWVSLSINEIVSKKWEILNKKGAKDLQWSRSDSIIRRNIFVIYKRR